MLPAGGSCLLGSVNLSEFVVNGEFDFNSFKNAVRVAVDALNEVLIEGVNLHPLQEQTDSVSTWRQIGLGIMGLADMLIKCGIIYGSKDALELCDKIGFVMATTALDESSKLVEKYGCFKECDMHKIGHSKFFENHSTKEIIGASGLANSQVLTIAPTGSLSTMLGISGGIEPIFANYYTRKTESLHGEDTYYKVYTPIVGEYMRANDLENEEDLPEYFVTAQDLDYRQRIDMQSVWQKHIDASISSTVNVPNEFTVEDTYNLYMYAWEKGLKGITIYRDGCSRTGILTTSENSSKELKRGEVIPVNDDLIGLKKKLTTGCGSLHCEAFFDEESGEMQEIYLSKGSTGGCNNFMIGLSRMISTSLRAGVSLDDIVDQLTSTGSCPSYSARSATKRDTSKGSCCPMAIGYALKDLDKRFKKSHEKMKLIEPDEQSEENKNGRCPICGEPLVFEGGCNICKSCGWTKCD